MMNIVKDQSDFYFSCMEPRFTFQTKQNSYLNWVEILKLMQLPSITETLAKVMEQCQMSKASNEILVPLQHSSERGQNHTKS